MLPHHGVVDGALADEEFRFQVFRAGDQRSLRETFRVRGLRIHIALAVHHFIPFPVDHRAAGHRHLEHVGVVDRQRDGHESAVAPAVDADAVAVHPGMRHQPFHAFHLVGHLGLAALAVNGLLVFGAVVGRTAVVHREDDVAVLGHIDVPARHTALIDVADELRMRTAIDVEDHGILLRRIEVDGIHQAVVVVILAVGTLDRTHFDLAAGQQGVRLPGAPEFRELLAVGGPPAHHAGLVERGPGIHEIFAVRRDLAHMPAFPARQPLLLARLEVHPEQVVLHGRDFGRIIVDVAAALRDVRAVGVHVGQALGRELAAGRAEVVVLEAVAVVGEIQELVGIALQEDQRLLRLHPAAVLFGEERTQALSVGRVIDVQVDVLLGTVEHLDVDPVAARAPGDVGQVALVVEVGDVHPHRRAFGDVIHAEGDVLGGHAVHRVADFTQGTRAGRDVEQGEERDGALVLAVERDLAAVGRHEDAAVDAEFVAAHARATDDAGVLISRDGVLDAGRIAVIQIVVTGIGEGLGTGTAHRAGSGRFVEGDHRLVAGPVPAGSLDCQAAAQHGFFHGHDSPRILGE